MLKGVDPVSVAFVLVGLVSIVLLLVYGFSDGSTKEKMDAGPVLEDPVAVPRVAQHEADPAGGAMRLVGQGITKLPVDLYAALNYGGSQVERIPATAEMLDCVAEIMDNTAEQAGVGAPVVFNLRQQPTLAQMQAFNGRAVAAADPADRPDVVTVFQTSNSPSLPPHTVYAFIDRGVKWGGHLADFCEGSQCTRSDIFVANTRSRPIPLVNS